MQSHKSDDKYTALKGNAVIVFLYLLHYPDYAYNIVKIFDELSEKKKLNVPLSLARYSNVYKMLSQLKKAGFINKEEIEVKEKPGLKRIVYHVNLRKIHPFLDDSQLLIFIKSVNEKMGKEQIIKQILSFEKYDYLTILLYFRERIFNPVLDSLNHDQWVCIREAVKELKRAGEKIESDGSPQSYRDTLVDYLSKADPSSLKYVLREGPPRLSTELTYGKNMIYSEIRSFLDDLILKEIKQERGVL